VLIRPARLLRGNPDIEMGVTIQHESLPGYVGIRTPREKAMMGESFLRSKEDGCLVLCGESCCA